MTPNKVREVLVIYRKKFDELGVPRREFPKNRHPNRWQNLAHCHNMLDEMETFIQQNRMDKVFRSLGFIQGVLCAAGIYTTEELANHNQVYGPRDCKKCGSPPNNHEVRNLDEILRTGDVYCTKCGAYVRMWDP